MDLVETLAGMGVLPARRGALQPSSETRGDPAQVDLLTRLHGVLSNGGFDQQRWHALQKLREDFGDDPRLLFQLFRICEHKGDHDEAIDQLSALFLRLGRHPLLLRKMAASQAARGSVEEACRYAMEWARAFPHDAVAQSFVSHYHEKCGRMSDACAAAEGAVTANPYNYNALCRAGRLQLRANPERAATYLVRAATLWPSSFSPLFLASKAKAAVGDRSAALRYLESAISLQPDHPGAQRYRSALLAKETGQIGANTNGSKSGSV